VCASTYAVRKYIYITVLMVYKYGSLCPPHGIKQFKR